MAAYALDCSQAGDLRTSLCDSFASCLTNKQRAKEEKKTHLIPLFLANSRVCIVLKQSCASLTAEIIPRFALTAIQEREKKKKKRQKKASLSCLNRSSLFLRDFLSASVERDNID